MNLNIDFFKIVNNHAVGKGLVLISEPFLGDTYFKRSVVYLTEHNKEGSIGFVLNKPVDLKIQEIIEDFPEFDASISIGGPVNTNTIHYIHTLGEIIPGSLKVRSNIYMGGDFTKMKDLISAGLISREQIRFFLGYSGWAVNQLDNELADNAWLLAEINPDLIMRADQSTFWNQVLENMGNKYQVWANFPENPGLN